MSISISYVILYNIERPVVSSTIFNDAALYLQHDTL